MLIIIPPSTVVCADVSIASMTVRITSASGQLSEYKVKVMIGLHCVTATDSYKHHRTNRQFNVYTAASVSDGRQIACSFPGCLVYQL